MFLHCKKIDCRATQGLAVPRAGDRSYETSSIRGRSRSHLTYVTDGQGRREQFRAPGQKFRLGPLVSGAPKSRDEHKKGRSVRRCSNFGPKSSNEQKKGHSLRRCSNYGSTSSDEPNKVIAVRSCTNFSPKSKKTSPRPQAVV